MEFAMLAVEADSINDLVKRFKRKIAPELNSGSYAVIFEVGDKSGFAKILTIRVRPYYGTYMIFAREVKGRILIIDISTAPYHDTDGELRITGRIMEQIIDVAKNAEIIYNSAWVYDDDEKIQERAILGLERVDDGIALGQLVHLLRHGRSNAIREKAGQSLGRIGSEEAAKALEGGVRSYTHGQGDRPSVAAACAQALGATQSSESLEILNELLVVFAKKKLDAQARTVKQAIYRIEHGTDLEETVCIVCNQPVEKGIELLQCPACKGVAHREHLLEWLHVKDYCPNCKKHMNEASIKRTRLENLPRKTTPRKGAKGVHGRSHHRP